jgi:hypothetical protein
MPKSTKIAKQKDEQELAEDADELEAYQEDSGFTSPIHEITYIDPAWPKGSFWTMRAQISDEDETAIEELTQNLVLNPVSNAQIAKWQHDGKNVQQEIMRTATVVQTETGRRATLAQLTVEWGGPRFTLPKTYSLERDPETKQPIVHELAGQVPPPTPEWIRRLGRGMTSTAYWHMYPFWTGLRGPDEDARFSEGPAGPRRSEIDDTAEAEISLPASAA